MAAVAAELADRGQLGLLVATATICLVGAVHIVVRVLLLRRRSRRVEPGGG